MIDRNNLVRCDIKYLVRLARFLGINAKYDESHNVHELVYHIIQRL